MFRFSLPFEQQTYANFDLFDSMHNGVGCLHQTDGEVERVPPQIIKLLLKNNFHNVLVILSFTFIVAETVREIWQLRLSLFGTTMPLWCCGILD